MPSHHVSARADSWAPRGRLVGAPRLGRHVGCSPRFRPCSLGGASWAPRALSSRGTAFRHVLYTT
eukprot:6477985-Pyramimonas_sp.AAC.1